VNTIRELKKQLDFYIKLSVVNRKLEDSLKPVYLTKRKEFSKEVLIAGILKEYVKQYEARFGSPPDTSGKLKELRKLTLKVNQNQEVEK